MNGLYRILGAAAAVAVGSIAIAAVNKLLEKDSPLYVESTEYPEMAEKDPEKAAEVSQAYDEAVQQEEAAQEEGATQQEEAAPAAPAEPDGPNPNPVAAAPAQAPKDADGKFDATRIASPEDFANWEDMGCQG